jgi:ATP-dependent Clp protease adaptor protein ClpS
MPGRRRDAEGEVKERTRLKKPRKYKVLIHNDDYTTMEFVVYVLQVVFHHSPASASRIMLHIHKSGIGVAGIYTRDIAETRVDQVMQLSREAGHPLQCTMEPE